MKKEEIRFLTPMRGVAALLVGIFHWLSYVIDFRMDLASFTSFFDRGYLWVDFFFVLSGFVMSHVYGSNFLSKTSKINITKFLIARFARIYPLYFVVLISYLMFYFILTFFESYTTYINDPRYSYKGFFASLLMIQALGWMDELAWNLPAWSISVEFALYFIFPWLIFAFTSRLVKLLLVSCSVYIYFYVSMDMPYGLITMHVDYGLIRGWGEFLLGILTYQYTYKVKFRYLYLSVLPSLFCLLLIFVGLNFGQERVADYWFVAIFSLLICCLANYRGNKLNLLDSQVANWLGNISYSIYMNHLIVVEVLYVICTPLGTDFPSSTNLSSWHPSFWESIAFLLLTLSICLGLSHLSYYYIELPAKKWILVMNKKYKKFDNSNL